MEYLLKLALGILGILLFSLFKSRKFIKNYKEFSLGVIWHDYRLPALWSILVIGVVLTILAIEPEASNAIKAFTGIDLENTKIGFLTFGLGLSALFEDTSKNRLSEK